MALEKLKQTVAGRAVNTGTRVGSRKGLADEIRRGLPHGRHSRRVRRRPELIEHVAHAEAA